MLYTKISSMIRVIVSSNILAVGKIKPLTLGFNDKLVYKATAAIETFLLVPTVRVLV